MNSTAKTRNKIFIIVQPESNTLRIETEEEVEVEILLVSAYDPIKTRVLHSGDTLTVGFNGKLPL